jgi:hypothetical protein
LDEKDKNKRKIKGSKPWMKTGKLYIFDTCQVLIGVKLDY